MNGNVYVKGNISTSGGASIGGSLSVADQIQFNYSANPTLTTTSIGYTYDITLPASYTGGIQTYTTQAVPKGVYICFAYLELVTAQTQAWYEILISGNRTALAFAGSSGFNYFPAISCTATCTATSTNISLSVLCTTTSNTAVKFFRIVRIA